MVPSTDLLHLWPKPEFRAIESLIIREVSINVNLSGEVLVRNIHIQAL